MSFWLYELPGQEVIYHHINLPVVFWGDATGPLGCWATWAHHFIPDAVLVGSSATGGAILLFNNVIDR